MRSRPFTLHGGTALGAAFKVGAVLQPSSAWRLAVAWQQGADLIFVGDFYLDMDHDFFTTDLTSEGLSFPRQVRGTAFVAFPTPSVLRVGVAWLPHPRWSWHTQASWLRYSVVKSRDVTVKAPGLAQPKLGLGQVTKIGIDRSWRDTLEVETWLETAPTESWRFAARLGYHSPVSPDRTMDMLALDGHRLVAGLSGQLRLNKRLAVSVQAMAQTLLTRVVAGSAHDRGNGTYDLSILVLGLGVQQAF